MASSEVAPGGTPCDYLEWDSEFFGIPIARVRGSRLNDEVAAKVVHWAADRAISCVYFFADPGDRATVLAAERHGFSLVDWRVTYAIDVRSRHASTGGSDGMPVVRPVVESDLPALRVIARESHTDSRFYFDGRFPRERCDKLYETWIERSCRGAADLVLVPDIDGAAAGYVTGHLDEANGRIGLVGLHQRARGRGIAGQMIATALDWFGERQARRVSVVTQGRNLAAARLYERCGFTIASAMAGYHWWSNQHRP